MAHSRSSAHGGHNSGAAVTPIERLLAEGQSLVVQVVKDPIGTKGARLSTQIQYIMAVSRIAHYLKAMMRDKVILSAGVVSEAGI